MAVTAEPSKGSLRIAYGPDEMKYTVTKLDAVADADSLGYRGFGTAGARTIGFII